MRDIRLSGRERSVIRAIGFGLSVTGEYLLERTGLAPEDLADVLSGMISSGFAESIPNLEAVVAEDLEVTEFEINPAYAHQLKEAVGF